MSTSKRCATVGCRAQADTTVSWSMRDDRAERTTDRVCSPCAESYLRRPALQARIEQPLTNPDNVLDQLTSAMERLSAERRKPTEDAQLVYRLHNIGEIADAALSAWEALDAHLTGGGALPNDWRNAR